MRALAIAALLAGCGASYDVTPLSTEDYASLDTPIMAGGETLARPMVYTDYDGIERAISAEIFPADACEVSLDEDGSLIRLRPPEITMGKLPNAVPPGDAILRVMLDNDFGFERGIFIRPRAYSLIVPERVPLEVFPARKLPGERLAVFEGERLSLRLEHYAADGTRLLGHRLDESWTAEGVDLFELEADGLWEMRDLALLRSAVATTAGLATIRAGDAQLPLDIVAPRTTARIELVRQYEPEQPVTSPIILNAGMRTAFYVVAYAADGRFIYGDPPAAGVEVQSADPGVAGRDGSTIYPDRAIWLSGVTAGSTTLTIRFDGVSLEVPVTVY